MSKIIFKADIDFEQIKSNLIPLIPYKQYYKDLKSTLQKLSKSEKAKKNGLKITMEIFYTKRTLDMNALMWALYEILLNEQNAGKIDIDKNRKTTMDLYLEDLEMYADRFIIKTKVGSEETFKDIHRIRKYETKGNYIYIECYKSTSMMTTVEHARWVEMIFDKLAEFGIIMENSSEIKNYWIDFKQHLNDKQINLYEDIRTQMEYKSKIINCEACGEFLGNGSGSLDHISTRASGVTTIDETENSGNWLHLCDTCHLTIKHQKGIDYFIKIYPHLKNKILSALKR